MNIATSPELSPQPAHGGTSALFAPAGQESDGSSFADLLGAMPEADPDEMPGPLIAPALPRKPAMDGTDPALAVLLPFMLSQVPPTLPPPVTVGAAGEITGNGSAPMSQPGMGAPFSAESGSMSAVSFAPRQSVVVQSAAASLSSETAGMDSVSAPESGTDASVPGKPGVMPAVSFAMRKNGGVQKSDAGIANEVPGSDAVSVPESGSDAPAPRQPGVMPAVSFAPRKNGSAPNSDPGLPNEIPAVDSAAEPQPGFDAAAPMQSGVMPAMPFVLRKTTSVPGSPVPAAEMVKDDARQIPTPATQPAQAALPGTDAPAEFSSPVVKLTSSSTPPAAEATAQNRAGQRQTQPIPDAASVPKADGMSAAMPRPAMADHFINHAPKTSLGAVASAPDEPRASVAPAAREESTFAPAVEFVSAAFPMVTVVAAPQNGTEHRNVDPGVADFTAAEQVTRQTFDLAEKVHTMGQDRAEVRMRLHDGQEVTVSLRLERGEWKPVFKTETEALCRALEQNWQRVAAQPSVQSVKFGTPVFESQGAHADPGRNPQQQSGGRERSFNHRDQEPSFGVPTPPARTSAKAVRSPAVNTVQLYA